MSALSVDDITKLTVLQLRSELRKRELSTLGLKFDLIERLAKAEGLSLDKLFPPVLKKAKSSSSSSSSSASSILPTIPVDFTGDVDDLKLKELFTGGAEAWYPRLLPILEQNAKKAALIVGPNRSTSVVPGRPLIFQALKARPIEQWNVIVFGQNPYPRLQSATGIAMFDNEFSSWDDSRFSKVVTMRTIAKAALCWKTGAPASTTTTGDVRQAFKKMKIVEPPDWFAAMLSQGVLLLNASLTANCSDMPADDPAAALTAGVHEKFWQPVVQEIVRSILAEKSRVAAATGRSAGVVFCWWGVKAAKLRNKFVDPIVGQFANVDVVHLEHPNPAAQGEVFCNQGRVFGDVNDSLRTLGVAEINWLPDRDWWQQQQQNSSADAGKMSDFIAATRELHQQFLDRISDLAADIGLTEMAAVADIAATPPQSFPVATAKIAPKMNVDDALAFAAGKTTAALDRDEIAAIHLYTSGSNFYKQLNETLRNPDRSALRPYYGYLRIFLGALDKLRRAGHAPPPKQIFRGIAADLRKDFRLDATVVWWGASSCSAAQSVAHNFSSGSGVCMLFRIQAVSAVGISHYSAFQSEEEYLLPPGTQLKVTSVSTESNFVTVVLEELDVPHLIQ